MKDELERQMKISHCSKFVSAVAYGELYYDHEYCDHCHMLKTCKDAEEYYDSTYGDPDEMPF